MTDQEMLERLRDEHIAVSRTEATDYIEKLVKERNELAAALDENWVTHQEVMQAKMQRAKAVEALRNILSGDDLYPWRIAREVLAELEKTK